MKAWLLAGIIAATIATPGQARTLDPAKPEDALEVMKRTQCGAKDGEPAVYHWSGKVYSRVEGERDRLLFLGEGMNIRQCVAVTDPKRGKGFRQVSREVMLFLDPGTGQVLRQWKNPWTGENVEVMHIANDPVNGRPTFPMGADGKPYSIAYKRMGDWVQMPLEVPLFYHNVLGGDYEDYVGNQYHAMEIFDFAARADELFDTAKPTAYPSVSWVRISNWMPWMKMGSRQGLVVFNAMGAKVKSFDELPAVLKQEIAANYPAWTSPPPGDDARPNETTWTVFKKKIDEERKSASGTPQPQH
jgi:hypothetical protein